MHAGGNAMKKWMGPLVVLVVVVLIWEVLHDIVGSTSLGSPAATVAQLWQMLGTVDFWVNVAETGRALGYALVLSVVGGIALGVALGVNRMAGTVAEPILVNLYSLPKVTLYPLVLLVFGLGLSAKVAFGVMHGLIPILVFTMNAIRQMKPVYLRTAHAMRMPLRQVIVRIVLPAIFPEIVAGMRLGFSLTMLGVLIGEMFASQKGLGYMLTNAMNLGDIGTIMSVALFLTLFALLCNGLLLAADKRLQHR